MIDMGTHWNTGSNENSRVLYIEAHTIYQMVQEDEAVCNDIQGYTLAHSGVQWIFRVFPLGRPPNRDLEHTIEFDLRRIDDGMGEIQRVVYLLMINIDLGYHQKMEKEYDTQRSTSQLHYGFLFTTLGLTHTHQSLYKIADNYLIPSCYTTR